MRNRSIVRGWIAMAGLAGLSPLGASAADCALGERYLALANDRIAAYATEEAAAFLKQSIEACPTFEAWQQLGEVSAQSTEAEDKRGAVDAFVAAHELAPDNRSRARALYGYASLLAREGDPQNAYPLIRDARLLNPQDAEIAALAAQVEAQVAKPTREHLVRGLRDSLYRPLRIASLVPGKRAGATRPQAPLASGPSVSIPINFESASTFVDELTRPNVQVLARALADPSFAGRRFVFIGHADQRGTEVYNERLSRQRAEAIYQGVISIEPTLTGRVEIVGRGAAEPIAPGNSEVANRANRRLQVLLK